MSGWTCFGMLLCGVVLLAVVSRSEGSCRTSCNTQDSLTRNGLVPNVSTAEVKKVSTENLQAASAEIFPCMTLCSQESFFLPIVLGIKPRALCMVVNCSSAQLHPHPSEQALNLLFL